MKLKSVTYETNKSLWGYDAFYFVKAGKAKKATCHKELLGFEISDEEGYVMKFAWVFPHDSGWLLWGQIPHMNWCGPLDWKSSVDALEPRLTKFISSPALP